MWSEASGLFTITTVIEFNHSPIAHV